ncbi:MAG: ABC transporter permease, partial [Bacteroidota bacterium]
MIKKTLVQLKESFLFTIHAVVMNRLRTILSLLGITIGIFAIISVLTIVDSLEKNIRESVASLGDNIVYIQKWPWGGMEGTYAWWDYLKRPVPKINEYEEIKRRSSLAENLAFSVSTSKNIEYRDNIARNVIIWANTHEFQDIRKFELSAGRYFTLLESSAGRNVSIIGHELAGKFFKNEKPIGKEIKILGRKTSIIGIAAKEGKNLFGGGSLDNVILIPINYAKQLVDVRKESLNPFIMVEAKPNIKAHELSYELKGIMRSVRGLKPREVDDFALNQSSLLSSSLDQVFSIINFAGWFIGAFSILVGGFGIANIMFVSVKERTSIIGIQK